MEQFIDKIKGHVAQQTHLGYILLDSVARLWIKHGSAKTVLLIGMQRQLHPSLHFISESQFNTDVVWFFGALQQAITQRGRSIIMEYEAQQDGICTWRKFLKTYRYNGNVSVYLREQQTIVNTDFTLD